MKPRAKEIAAMARARLLDPSPTAVERLERALGSAMVAAEWNRATWLLGLRRQLSAQLRDDGEALAALGKIGEAITYGKEADLRPGWDDCQVGQP